MKKDYAKKSLGQNFLNDRRFIDKILQALKPRKNDLIVEIGPGRGALTEPVLERAGKVLAIEFDRDLIPILEEKFKFSENFFLIEQDALETDFRALVNLQSPPHRTKLVANLPYYISTAILQHLINYRVCFSEMILMLQKEVVERITADPGNKERGFLTVLIEAYFKTEKLFDVPPGAFQPAPKVISSVMRLITKENGKDDKMEIKDHEFFRKLISRSFLQKRKTLRNNLKNAPDELGGKIEFKGGLDKIFTDTKIDPKKRAENLELEEWIKLSNYLSG